MRPSPESSRWSDRVALTGATGFIGQHLLRALVARGHHVRALIRRRPSDEESPNIEWIRGNLGDSESLNELVRGASTVIHCAGVVRGASLGAFDEVNALGTERLANAALDDGGVRRVLLVSSLAAREPYLSWYARSKRRSEELLAKAAGNRLSLTVFRPTAVYGPGDVEMRPLLLAMRRGLLPVVGSPTGRISLLHVEDLVRAVITWLDRSDSVAGTFELHDGAPDGYTWRRILEIGEQVWNRRVRMVPVPAGALFALGELNLMLARIRDRPPMLTPGKVRELRHRDWTCSNEAVTAALGWEPSLDFATALRQDKVFGS